MKKQSTPLYKRIFSMSLTLIILLGLVPATTVFAAVPADDFSLVNDDENQNAEDMTASLKEMKATYDCAYIASVQLSKGADLYVNAGASTVMQHDSGESTIMFEWHDTASYRKKDNTSNNKNEIRASVVWIGTDSDGNNVLYYSSVFGLNDAIEDFLNQDNSLNGSETKYTYNAFAVVLPNVTQVVGMYFAKLGNGGNTNRANPWASADIRITSVENFGSRSNYKFNYTGTLLATVSSWTAMNEDRYYADMQTWDSDDENAGSNPTTYLLELTFADNGIASMSGANITLNYTNADGKTKVYRQSLSNFYSADFNNLLGLATSTFSTTNLNALYTATSWSSARAMSSVHMAGRIYNAYNATFNWTDSMAYYSGTVNPKSANLGDYNPYTKMQVYLTMPSEIKSITSIVLSAGTDAYTIDNMCISELDSGVASGDLYGYGIVMNGTIGSERVIGDHNGEILVYTDGYVTVAANGSATFSGSLSGSNKLYTSTATTNVTSSAVGFSFKIADIDGGGIDTFLASRTTSLGNLDALTGVTDYNEPLYLKVQYRDNNGATRIVYLPWVMLYTEFVMNAFYQNYGVAPYTYNSDYDLRGLFTRGQEVGFYVYLEDYDYIQSLTLTYGGSAPSEMDWTQSGKTMDTGTDTLTIDSFSVYETDTHTTAFTNSNFTVKYENGEAVLYTPTPTKSYSTTAGKQFSAGTSLEMTSSSFASGAATEVVREEATIDSKYLFEIHTSNITNADTIDDLTMTVNYTSTSGIALSKSGLDVSALSYAYAGGLAYDGDTQDTQYLLGVAKNGTLLLPLDIQNVQTIDSLTLTLEGSDNWQFNSVDVIALEEYSSSYFDTTSDAMKRDYSGDTVASFVGEVLLSETSPTRTINFTSTNLVTGVVVEPDTTVGAATTYITEIPSELTYAETQSDLGLTVAKYDYTVDVYIPDEMDAGSANYFYFQLIFENGSSGVVLANTQLASDGFRQNYVESFQISTTQYYGDVTSVRIICDNVSSTSNVFDKMKVSQVAVSLASTSGVNLTWVADSVGWVDIEYLDEGISSSSASTSSTSLVRTDVTQEFPITSTAIGTMLFFCLTTAPATNGEAAITPGTVNATLNYYDGDGLFNSYSFDLTSAYKSFNESDKTACMYRLNSTDRFSLTLLDIASIESMTLSRTGGTSNWYVDSVSVQLVSSLGSPYLNSGGTAYLRDAEDAEDLTKSTNAITVPANGSATMSFTANEVTIVSSGEYSGWDSSTGFSSTDSVSEGFTSTVTSVPDVAASANFYLFGSDGNLFNYTFDEDSPTIQGAVMYTSSYGGVTSQSSFTLSNIGTSNGKACTYIKNFDLGEYASIDSVVLGITEANISEYPYVDYGVLEVFQGDTIIATYYYPFLQAYMGLLTPAATTNYFDIQPQLAAERYMEQSVTLSLTAGQSALITSDNDIAVAITYTLASDPASDGAKTEYRSPYVFASDVGYTSLEGLSELVMPLSCNNVYEITGIEVVSGGNTIGLESAVIKNYLTYDGTLLGAYSINGSFNISSTATRYDLTEGDITPVAFTFTTGPESYAPGAGTNDTVSMAVDYITTDGIELRYTYSNVDDYITYGEWNSGEETVVEVNMADVAEVTGVTLSVDDDSLFVMDLTVVVTAALGGTTKSSISVNNWAHEGDPMVIDMSSTVNKVNSFVITATAASGQTASTANGEALVLEVYGTTTVSLTPTLNITGSPDTMVSWSAGDYSSFLAVDDYGKGTFRIPGTLSVGDGVSLLAICDGDYTKSIPVTIVIVEQPVVETTTSSGLFDDDDSGDDTSSSESSSGDGE